MLKVSAIIVTFNRLHILRECLKSLLNQSYDLNNIIIINNNSSDGTKEYLENLNNPLIKYKNLNKNIGGSGGFSLGTKMAYEHSDSQYFWLMDDDSLPTHNALKNLISSINTLHNNFGFLCSNVRSNNNIPVNLPFVNKKYWTELLPSNLVRVNQASFVSLLFSRDIVKTLGLPIGEMFIWGDDYEYTTRISSKYKCYFVSDSIVIHASLSSNKGSKEEETVFNTNRIKFYECSYRNYLYIRRKYNGFSGVAKKILGDIRDLLKMPFKSKNKCLTRCYYVIIGMAKGLFFNPNIKFPTKNN